MHLITFVGHIISDNSGDSWEFAGIIIVPVISVLSD
jgi:hypothetical protein